MLRASGRCSPRSVLPSWDDGKDLGQPAQPLSPGASACRRDRPQLAGLRGASPRLGGSGASDRRDEEPPMGSPPFSIGAPLRISSPTPWTIVLCSDFMLGSSTGPLPEAARSGSTNTSLVECRERAGRGLAQVEAHRSSPLKHPLRGCNGVIFQKAFGRTPKPISPCGPIRIPSMTGRTPQSGPRRKHDSAAEGASPSRRFSSCRRAACHWSKIASLRQLWSSPSASRTVLASLS